MTGFEAETRIDGTNMNSNRCNPRRRVRLLLPFTADVLSWTFVTVLALVFSGVPEPASVPTDAGGAVATLGDAPDGGELFALAAPFTEWNAIDQAGRRDGVRPRSTRQRGHVPIAATQATSRARATNAERLRFLPSLAGSRIGVLSAGHASLPPPNRQV